MLGRERELLSMNHKEPDRVPVQCQLSMGHFMLNTPYEPHEIWYETEAFADALVILARRYKFDGFLVLLGPGRPKNYLDNNVVSREDEEDGYWLTWKNGDRTWFVWDDFPHHYPADITKPQRANFETFDPDKDMDFIEDYLGYTWNVRHHLQEIPDKSYKGILTPDKIPDYFSRMWDILKEKDIDDLTLHASVYSPLTHYFELFGYEDALMGFVIDPGKVHAVLDRFVDHVVTWALAQIKWGAQAVDLSSAFVASPFLSRKMYKEFVVPYEERVNEAIKSAGCIVYTHSCGSIGDRLDLLVETGTQGIDTLDPPPLGDGDLAAAKRDFGEKLFFKGNIDSVALLEMKTEGEVERMVRNTIEIGKPGSGFILDAACAIAPHVEPWKMEMLVPLAEKYGRY
jgi:uroporphyrinogen-III decarboxylase